MKRLVGIVGIVCGLLLIGHGLCAQGPARIPAYPGPIERVQPDGDTIIVRLYGDERRHYMTTEDHYLVKEDKRGYICYAQEKKNGQIVATRRVAHNEDKRSECEKKYIDRKGIKKSHNYEE